VDLRLNAEKSPDRLEPLPRADEYWSWPSMSSLTRKALTLAGVSCLGSTLTAIAGTRWRSSFSAPRICETTIGQVSWQVE
jgi:hypothetical protein